MPFQSSEPAGAEAGDTAPATNHASLDDVFGLAQQDAEQTQDTLSAAYTSDMRRLQSKHATAGYREGIAAAKQSTIHVGFDAGFSLGASMGLSAGRMLGLLEGICDAVRVYADEAAAAAAEALLAAAQAELSSDRILDPAYWTPDAVWTLGTSPAKEGDDALFQNVANAHPLMAKWDAIVSQQKALWKIDEAIFHSESGPRLGAVTDEAPRSSAPSTAAQPRPLDW